MKMPTLVLLAVVLAGCAGQNPPTPARTFSEQEVRDFVTPGRTIVEITNRFGVPGAVMTNDGRIVMWFSNPIDLVSENPAKPFAFSASFTNGLIEKWEGMHVTAHEMK